MPTTPPPFTKIATYLRNIVVSWIDYAVIKAFGQVSDRNVEAALTARREAFIETQSGDMLDYSARNSDDQRVLFKYPRPETDAELRAYLQTRWDRHLEAGVQDALDFQVQRWGFVRYTWVSELALRVAGYTPTFGNDADGLVSGNPGPGSNFFAVIIHPGHYFQEASAWDDGSDWDAGQLWDFGSVYGYSTDAGQILRAFCVTMGEWRQAGASLRHVVVDFAGDCVVNNAVPLGYSGTSFSIFPNWEPNEILPGGVYPPRYNVSWKFP